METTPVRAAHTGGDTIVRFENANVIMIGDFYRNYGYPYIDIANGGSLKGMLEALDAMMKIAGPNTKLVPGHGTIITRSDLVRQRRVLRVHHEGAVGTGQHPDTAARRVLVVDVQARRT